MTLSCLQVMHGTAPYMVNPARVHDAAAPQFVRHPRFLKFGSTVPLTYSLLAMACLSVRPEERPCFEEVLAILHSLNEEIATGSYGDTTGRTQVCLQPSALPIALCMPQCRTCHGHDALETA
jgi:hypothetical protein